MKKITGISMCSMSKAIVGMLIILQCYSCQDIFVSDISDEKLIVFSPEDTLKTNLNSILFWWDAVEDAESYHLQIVSPTFNNVQQFFADSMVSNDRYTVFLQPGSYSWRIRACNSEYYTEWVNGFFEIDSTPDLSNQQIELFCPSDKDTTNIMYFFFKWYSLYNADSYNFEIRTPNLSGTKVISLTIQDTSFNYTLPEGSYYWGVQAQNSSSKSNYFYRQLYIDTTSPGTPLLMQPLDKAVLNDSNIIFSWNHPIMGGSSVRSTFCVFSDSLLTDTIINKDLLLPTYTDSIGPGSFWWHVRAIDKAGNTSLLSNVRKLTIQ